MLKKFFLLLIVAMLNVVAWATPEIQITPYAEGDAFDAVVGDIKFFEPVVTVKDGDENKTGLYTISYSLAAPAGGSVIETTDSRGVTISKITSGAGVNTTVEKYYGDVKMGGAGTVTVNVTAVPKSGTDDEKIAGTLNGSYRISIATIPVTLTFTPGFAAAESPSASDGLIKITTKKLHQAETRYYLPKVKAMLPSYAITTEKNGVVTDITSHFTVETSLTNNFDDRLSIDDKKTNVLYKGMGSQYYGVDELTINNEIEEALNTGKGTIVYTFTPKDEHEGFYSPITKTIDVKIAVASGEEKETLSLNLTRNHIVEEDVTPESGSGPYTIHVYKYGKGTYNSYNQHKVPAPSVLTSKQAAVDAVNGNLQLVYEVVEDKAYFDDCFYDYFSKTGTLHLQKEGEPTGINVTNKYFQTNIPGKVKVNIYAAAVVGSEYELNDLYTSKGTKNIGGTNYTLYTDPVEFYIDVMPRKPEVVMDPDPENLYFLRGQAITMEQRFEISGHIGSESNGVSGDLTWGAQGSSSENDHFSYRFFIADRNNLISITWPTKENDGSWETNKGNQFSYYDWQPAAEYSEDKTIQIGDIIKIGTKTITLRTDYDVFADTDVTSQAGTIIGKTAYVPTGTGTETTPIVLTPDNVGKLYKLTAGTTITINDYAYIASSTDVTTYTAEPYSHGNITEGDFERGITYNSMKGYGNESWTMTFNADGKYNIPYMLHAYNHPRWDDSDIRYLTFDVKETKPTELLLSYYYKVVNEGDNPFTKPTEKVIVPSENNYDVTDLYNFSYTFDGTLGVDYTVSEGIQTHNATECTLNTSTGAVEIGNQTGEIDIWVSAMKKDASLNYDNPEHKKYRVRIVDGMATWEVISTDKTGPCEAHESNPRFTDEQLESESGRMHFLTPGDIYGGTLIEGVPGISMTIGAPENPEEDADWHTVETNVTTPKCCSHETNSVIVRSSGNVVIDDDGIPTGGAFYQFNPTVNGYLTVDAKFYKDRTIVLISKTRSGVIIDETFTNTGGTGTNYDGEGNLLGDYTFKRPLLAGETYYLYDVTYSMEFNLHGFKYEPAFIIDRSTTIEQSRTPLSATTFMNSLSNSLPKLYEGKNGNVVFSFDGASESVTISDYLAFSDDDGGLDPKAMTVTDDIFTIRIKATVKSTDDANLGTCTRKYTYYDVSILDIPTFILGNKASYEALNIVAGSKVTTTNISTDITMTFGGWKEVALNSESTDDIYNEVKSDAWNFKSAAGAASRIGSEGADNDETYNKTIDGFEYFNAGAQNPVDENNKGALQTGNGNQYTYGSGTYFEDNEDTYYNTTYRVPCRGAFVKFEPRESGTVLVYLVQNGACDYHYGLKNDVGSAYKLKWRPLYITDETGKAATMVDNFSAVSKYLPAGGDAAQAGSFTLGVARCNKVEEEVANAFRGGTTRANCSFDWSEFKGTEDDKAALLAAWPAKGERESIVRLSNGGFSLPHKAYVRYAFEVKAGKTYFVFQPGSKFEFGGFSFVPTGFPSTCKYAITSKPGALVYNTSNHEINWSGAAAKTTEYTGSEHDANGIVTDDNDVNERDNSFAFDTQSTRYTALKENLILTINDIRASVITANSLTPRTMTADKWESICLPFSVSSQEMKRVFGDSYVLATFEGYASDGKLHFVRHGNTYLEAGRPYLIRPSIDIDALAFKNVTVEGTATVKDKDGNDVKVTDPSRFNREIEADGVTYVFKGIYSRETMPAGSFFAREDGLYHFAVDSKIGGYRAYLQKNTPTVGSPLSFSAFSIEDLSQYRDFSNDDMATGIIAVNQDGEIDVMKMNTGVYNISGQKVYDNPLDMNNAPHGIYIINGKKYFK